MKETHTLNELMPLADVLYVFNFKNKTPLIGMEPSRIANAYKLTMTRIEIGGGEGKIKFGRVLVGFVRHEIRCLALLFDLWSTEVLEKPDSVAERAKVFNKFKARCTDISNRDKWEGMVRLVHGTSPTLRIDRYDMSIKDQPHFPDVLVSEYLTKQDVMDRDGISRQTVYNRTDRGELPAIMWQGHTLWLPASAVVT